MTALGRAITLLVVASTLAGCVGPQAPPSERAPFVPPSRGDYPEGDAVECPPHHAARGTTYGFRVRILDDRTDSPENHVTVAPDPSAPRRPVIEWTWAHVEVGERPERFTRANSFELWRGEGSEHHVCARIDLVTPDEETPVATRPMTLRVRATPTEDVPPGDYVLVVNWVLGCPSCGATVLGNATATFAVPAS